jgi:hypothetical protein
MIPSLPSYSSPSSPTYSSEPSFDEQSLDHTPSVGRPSIPTGTYVKTSDIFTLTLTDQIYGAILPTYGRSDLIKGVISLHDCAEVIAVNVKVSFGEYTQHEECTSSTHALQLDGVLKITIANGGVAKTPFLIAKRTIWTNEGSLYEMCPSSLPFEWALPSMYQERGESFPLPPSYEIIYPGDPKVDISCDYTLTIEAVKNQIIPLLKRRKRWTYRFLYSYETIFLLTISHQSQCSHLLSPAESSSAFHPPGSSHVSLDRQNITGGMVSSHIHHAVSA